MTTWECIYIAAWSVCYDDINYSRNISPINEKRNLALQGKVKHRHQPHLLPVKGGFRKEYLSDSA